MIFGDLATDTQHFGSTAIKSMSAKPIIDVMVLVSDISKADDLNKKMKEAGYVWKVENGIEDRRHFQFFSNNGINHIQHIHFYENQNQHAVDVMMFRDYLRVDKESFNMYLRIKIEGSQKFKFSPLEYTEYKTVCVNEIMGKQSLITISSGLMVEFGSKIGEKHRFLTL